MTRHSNVETFYGYLHSTEDALLLIVGCAQGILPRVGKRLDHQDRQKLRSGSVYVFDEHESGIRRWTDGRLWSPSRILGDFLVYKEVDRKEKPPRNVDEYNYPEGAERSSLTKDETALPVGPLTSQKGTYYFKQDGLIKKTISVNYQGNEYHLVSYYKLDDLTRGVLKRPSENETLSKLLIPDDVVLHSLNPSSTRSTGKRKSRDHDSDATPRSKGSILPPLRTLTQPTINSLSSQFSSGPIMSASSSATSNTIPNEIGLNDSNTVFHLAAVMTQLGQQNQQQALRISNNTPQTANYWQRKKSEPAVNTYVYNFPSTSPKSAE